MSDVVTIALTDPRLPQPAPAGTTTSSAVAEASKMPCRQDGTTMFFQVGLMDNGTAHEVSVLIEGGNLVFFPARSALQRELMEALGIGDS